ncbi:unnamed protein product [Caenorhabditis angaria]|uniref:Transmembrane protein n=1 Tax=Caenorhabditis angaria TaxID=860376 RepID=A0A9P1IXJ3_9PELO|nr:unnamed protein product [Caenorhabditis angaria]
MKKTTFFKCIIVFVVLYICGYFVYLYSVHQKLKKLEFGKFCDVMEFFCEINQQADQQIWCEYRCSEEWLYKMFVRSMVYGSSLFYTILAFISLGLMIWPLTDD